MVEVRPWCNDKCLPPKATAHRFESGNQPLQNKLRRVKLPTMTSLRPCKMWELCALGMTIIFYLIVFCNKVSSKEEKVDDMCCYHVTLSKFKHQIVKDTGGCYPLQFLFFINIIIFSNFTLSITLWILTPTFQFYPLYLTNIFYLTHLTYIFNYLKAITCTFSNLSLQFHVLNLSWHILFF